MDTSKIKVLAINGSVRPNDEIGSLLDVALQELELRGIHGERIDLSREQIHDCLDCLDCVKTRSGLCKQTDDAGNTIIEKMAQADGILLGSPVTEDGTTRSMKSLLDRASMVSKANGGFFRHKVGAALVTVEAAQALQTFDLLNHFFLVNEMIVAGSSYWCTGIAFDAGESARDPKGLAVIATLGRNMAWLLENLCGPIKLYESVEIVSQ